VVRREDQEVGDVSVGVGFGWEVVVDATAVIG